MDAVTPPGVDPELLARAAAADRGEAPPGPAANDAAPPAPPDESLLWINAVKRYGALARTMLPDEAAAHWTDERLENFGRELANCARHYGWRWGQKLTHPLALLVAAGWPLAWPIAAPYVMPYIVKALRGEAFDAANADEPEAPAPSADGGRTAAAVPARDRPFPDLEAPPPKPT